MSSSVLAVVGLATLLVAWILGFVMPSIRVITYVIVGLGAALVAPAGVAGVVAGRGVGPGAEGARVDRADRLEVFALRAPDQHRAKVDGHWRLCQSARR